jgi:hypothetical protein
MMIRMRQTLQTAWLIALLLISGTAQVRAMNPDELLVTPAMFVGELPSMLLTEAIPTTVGDLRYVVQPEISALLYQIDDTDIQTITLPDDVQPDFTHHQLTLLSEETQGELCLANATSDILLLVDFVTNEARSVGTCPTTRLPAQSGQPIYRVGESMGEVVMLPDRESVIGIFLQDVQAKHCALSLVNLNTKKVREVDDSTLCMYPAYVTASANGQFIFYVHYAAGNTPNSPRATLREVNLETGIVFSFNVEGKILQLISVAPEAARAVLLVDNHPDSVNTGFAGQGITRAHEPRWLVYDLIGDRIVYEKPLSVPASAEGFNLREELNRGALGFRWSITGWDALFLMEGAAPEAIFIQSEIRRTRTIALEGLLPLGADYAAEWSPDGTRLLITVGDSEDVRASYIFNVADEVLTPITLTEDETVAVQVVWDNDNTLIISIQSEDSPIAARWRIQPDPKSWT